MRLEAAHPITSAIGIALTALALLGACASFGSASARAGEDPSCGIVPNVGQAPTDVLYYARCGAVDVVFTSTRILLDFRALRRAVGVGLEDAGGIRESLRPEGVQETLHHYFLGDDPLRWRTDVPRYEALRVHRFRPGLDLVVIPRDDGLRYRFEPSGDPGDGGGMPLRIEGLELLPPGSFLDEPIGSGSGAILREGMLRWSPRAEGSEGGRDRPEALAMSTFLGGTNQDRPHGLTTDALGNLFVTGYSSSWNFPTTAGAYDQSFGGVYDVVVSKLDGAGSRLLWSTFLGGSEEDRCFAIQLDHIGNPVVAGLTYSDDFPTTAGALDREISGSNDGFVAKLSASGSVLFWSTFLGGSASDRVWDMDLDPADRPIVGGETYSSDFPTTPGAFDTTANGSADCYMTKLDASGRTIEWSTYFGGSRSDQITFLDINADQRIVATGNTPSPNFPTTPGSFDDTANGTQDAIVACFDATTGELLYSGLLGGAGEEWGNSIGVAPDGTAFVTGSTASPDYPTTTGAYDRSYNGDRDVFVARISPDGDQIVWSTYLGGGLLDEPYALILDRAGCPYVAGSATSPEFPTTTDAYDRTYGGGENDVFLTRVSGNGESLLWSTFLGGSAAEGVWELGLDASDNPLLTGPTRSSDFPTTEGAYDRSHNGFNDFFLTRFDVHAVTGLAAEPGRAPIKLVLAPNPSDQGVAAWWNLRNPGPVEMRVLDSGGRAVVRIQQGHRGAGVNRYDWDGRDAEGRRVARGIYWIRVEAEGTADQERVVIIR